MNVNQLIDDTLKSLDCPIYFEEANFVNVPTEHIVFSRIYGAERNFAGGNPIHNYHLYRVSFFGTKARRQAVMPLIKSKMKSAGFFVQTDNEPIPREANATLWGAFSEFSYWEVI